MSKTVKAFLISGSIIAVAVIVVVALALSGVFGINNVSNTEFGALAETQAVGGQKTLRGIDPNFAFKVRSSANLHDKNTLSQYVVIEHDGEIMSADGFNVTDEGNGVYGISKKDGFVAGNAYTITLRRDATFVDQAYTNASYVLFTVAKPEVQIAEEKEGLVKFTDHTVSLGSEDNGTIANAKGNTIAKFEKVTGEEGVDYSLEYNDDTTFEKGAVLIYGDREGKAFVVVGSRKDLAGKAIHYVREATVNDVFSKLDVNKDLDLNDITDFEIDVEESIKSLYNNSFLREAYVMLYEKEWVYGKDDSIKIKFEANKNDDNFTVDLLISFDCPAKGVASLTIKVANVLTLEPHFNYSLDPMQFEFTADIALETKMSLEFELDKSWSDAGTATELIQKLAKKAGKSLDESKTFMKFNIPIGNLPICISYEMGYEVSFGILGAVSAEATNTFEATVGVIYANKEFNGIGEYDNNFKVDGIEMRGLAEAKAGITNAIGISAYSVIGVDIDVAVGAYADLGGKFTLTYNTDGTNNLAMAYGYYAEAGIYLDLFLQGDVFTKEIARVNLLYKKWPLWTAGYRYIPTEFIKNTLYNEHNIAYETVDEVVYLTGHEYYLTGFKAKANDLKIEGKELKLDNLDLEKEVVIDYDQFKYELDDVANENLTLEGNRIFVKTTAKDGFTATIKVTSKSNNQVIKNLIIKKVKEAPSVTADTAKFDVAAPADVTFDIQLNTSKLIGLSDAKGAIAEGKYELNDNILSIKTDYLKTLAVGSVTPIVLESNKGNLNLYVSCFSSEPIVIENNTATFDKNNPVGITFDVDGNVVEKVTLNGADVDKAGYAYQAGGKKLVFFGNYLNTLAVGDYTFTVVSASDNNTADVVVSVVDNRKATLRISAYKFCLSGTLAVKVTVDNYGDAIESVRKDGSKIANDAYTVDGNVVSLSATYLKGLGEGTHAFVIETANGEELDFTVDCVNNDNGTVIFTENYKTFDKASNDTVSFAYKVFGNDAPKADSSDLNGFNVNHVTKHVEFPASVLKTWAVGEHKLSFNGQELVIVVTNSTPPSVVNESVLFDKNPADSDNCDVVVNVDLQDAVITSVEGIANYTYADGKITLAKEDLEVLPYGDNTLTVCTDVNTFAIVVRVVDTRPVSVAGDAIVTVNRTNKDYADASVALALYDAKLESVTSVLTDEVNGLRLTHYRYANGVLTFSNEYIYKLANGAYDYKVATSRGTFAITLVVQGDAPSAYDQIGYGTEEKPYMIFNYAQLKDMAEKSKTTDFAGQYIKVNSDIECRQAENNGAITPIGNDTHKFAGIFDGNGYTIKNIQINAIVDEATGLFNNIAKAGVVKNMVVENIQVNFNDNGTIVAGLIAGENMGTIENVKVSGGKISAISKSWLQNHYFSVGGVVGANAGTVRNVDIEVDIDVQINGKKIADKIDITAIFFTKSTITVGAVAGYLAEGSAIVDTNATGSVKAHAVTNNVTYNGVYGFTEANTDVDASFSGSNNIG